MYNHLRCAQDTYIAERARAMQSVEATIAELGDVFKQLATLIHDQGETVMRIDTNLTDAEVNVEVRSCVKLFSWIGLYSNGFNSIRFCLVNFSSVIAEQPLFSFRLPTESSSRICSQCPPIDG
jgi:hypothetical protein